MRQDAGLERELEELLVELVRIPSPNPPGDEAKMAGFVADYLGGAGLEVERVPLAPGRESVVARLPGREAGCLVLCGHLDTVAIHEEDWSVPPLSGHKDDGRIYGRGAADMKSGVAGLLVAARWAAALSASPQKSLVLALTADEERGYTGARSLVEGGHLDGAEFLLIAEPTDGTVFLGQKGELWIKAVFQGKAAHGSVPELGVNAALPAAEFSLGAVKAVNALPAGPRGKTSVNLGRIAGGWQVNVVPDRAEVELDVRTALSEHREVVLERVEEMGRRVAAHWGTSFSYALTNERAPIETPGDAPYIGELLAAVEEVTGKTPETGIAPYSTDAVEIVPRLGVPLAIYGPGSIAQAHRPDEYVEVRSLITFWRALTKFLELSLFDAERDN